MEQIAARLASQLGSLALLEEMNVSIDYVTEQKIRYDEIFDGRLEQFGILEDLDSPHITDIARCLTDGRNYVWAYSNDRGLLSGLTRYAGNAPQKILKAISEAFDTDIFSEHEPQFWGFETQEAWDAAWDAMEKESRDQFYLRILRHLRGEPNDIGAGTVGMKKARIAERLVLERPELMLLERKDQLMTAIDEVYDRDHAVRITLTPEDLAYARMLANHEEDLPRA